MKFWATIFLTLCLSGCAQLSFAVANVPSQLANTFTKRTESFGTADWQKLDVYMPNDATAKTPVVIFFYGGRWETGTREDYAFVGTTIAQEGYITVIPDYRKYPQVKFPTFVDDGAAAVAWTAKHFPGRAIHIAGHSAGAHIGALIVADKSYLAKYHLTPQIIANFIGLAGPYDFTPDEDDLKAIFAPPESYPRMQVTTFIDGHEPPMFLLQGEADKDVNIFNLTRLAQKIQSKAGKVTVRTYPDIDHTGIIKAFTWLEPSSPVRKDFFAFLAENSHEN